MTSIGLIADVLDSSTQYSIACFLRDKLLSSGCDKSGSTPAIKALAEILATSDSEWPDITDSIKTHLTELLWKLNDTDPTEPALLVQLIPSLTGGFLKETTTILQTYLALEEESLLKRVKNYEITEIHSDSERLRDNVSELALSHLKTLCQVCSTSADGFPDSPLSIELQKALLVCHSARNPEIAKLASRSMGMIVKFAEKLDPSLFTLWWECIYTCLNSTDSAVDPENAYVLWLRCISSAILSDSITDLQSLFNSEEYWGYLQDGILNKTYEIRKYTLYILSQSLQKIQQNIEISSMTWKMDKKETYIWEWQRYTTLVNIISIDTSLHQAEDSSADLIKIIGSSSLIPKSWARCLLSAGLQCSMESLRKFVGNVAMQLTANDMEIFATGFSFMTEILLPYLMSASHFTVEKSKDNSSIDICPFGERLSDFIAALFQYLDDATSRNACNTFLSLLYKQRFSFDPAILYIMYGVERGLLNRKVLSIAELDILKLMFSPTTETKLREKATFFLYFRLILSASDKLVPFNKWFSCLVDISTGNPQLYLNSANNVVEYILKSSYYDEFKKFGTIIVEESLYELLPIYLDLSIRLENQPDQNIFSKMSFSRLLDLSSSGIPSAIEFLHTSVGQTQLTHDLSRIVNDVEITDDSILIKISQSYSCLPESQKSVFQFAEVIPNYSNFVNSIWSPIYNLESVDESKVEHIYSRLSMVNIVLEQQDYSTAIPAIATEQLLKFLNRLIVTKTQTKQLNVIKNNALAELYRALFNVLKLGTVKVDEVLEAFISQFEFITSKCRYHICLSIQQMIQDDNNLVSKYADKFSLLLKTFWSALVADRLIATERTLHTAFINMAYSESVLTTAGDDSLLAETLEDITEELIQLCYGRRCLLPCLSEALYSYHHSHPENLYEWIGRVMLSIFTFIQINDNLFRLEHVIANNHDQLSKQRQGLKATPTIYTDEYGRLEISSKIDVLFSLSSLSVGQESSSNYAKYLFNFILTSPRYHLFEPIKRNDGLEEVERTRCYQILLILSRFIVSDLATIEKLTNDTFIPALYSEPSPVVRTYVEWIISRFTFYLLDNEKSSTLLGKLDNMEEIPRVVASYQRMCVMIARRLRAVDSSKWVQYYYDYILKVIPFSTSNRAAIRHFSVSMLCAMSNEFKESTVPAILRDLVAVIHGITDQAKSSDTYKQYRSGESSIWDIELDYTLVGVCGGVLKHVSDRVLGEIEQRYLASYSTNFSTEIPLGLDSEFVKWVPENATTDNNARKLQKDQTETKTSMPLQVKSTSWNSVMDMTVGEDGRDSDKVKRGELIVVSSLVDKPPNLGGICRLCDVLGAKQLCLNDISVTRNPQFKNVAVSADRWMPMIEVKETDIIKFMTEKKREGYTLIGLEQTDKSVQLNSDLKFPRKSLILLGKEREGIPGELLAELDFCVEIKQVGVIRSMNIQTATAVLVHSYSIQHC